MELREGKGEDLERIARAEGNAIISCLDQKFIELKEFLEFEKSAQATS